jgi:hypothetical protein
MLIGAHGLISPAAEVDAADDTGLCSSGAQRRQGCFGACSTWSIAKVHAI